jgi:hypothetical protein
MGNLWHVEGITPDYMIIEWDRAYDDDELLDLLSALVNGERWGTARLKLTKVAAVKG